MKKTLLSLLIALSTFIYTLEAQDFPVIKGEYLGQRLPGLVPVVFAPGIVSDTSWWEHCQLAVSPKGDEIFWSAWTIKYPKEDGKTSTEQIFYSELENGIWTKPVLAEFVKEFLTGNNGGPVFSLDGCKLFFYSGRPGGMGGMDTWYVERTENGWSKPINAGEPYNSANEDWAPVFTNSGNAYRMGNYYDDKNEKPLCFKYTDGKFSNPIPVTFHSDFFPWYPIYVSPNEDYAIFSAAKETGYGFLDLYISFKTTDGRWGYPINMGNKVNTESTERFPVVSPDGKYLFFMRQTETQDIFWVSTACFNDLKKESIEKVNTLPEYKAISLKSEDLDKYLGVYSCPDLPSNKITISKEGNILFYTTHQDFGDYSVPLECIDTDKFKYQSITKFEFLPSKNKLRIIVGNKTYDATKE
jgi:hypothetical protein